MPELGAIVRVVAIALACAAALATVNRLTEDEIRFNEAAVLRAAVSKLLPAGSDAPALPPAVDRVPGSWTLCSGHLLGRSNVRGYAGDIRLLYTLRREGKSDPGQAAGEALRLIRLSVLGHQETPGIADFLTDPDWLAAFSGASASEIESLSAITGATISSAAVRDHLATVLREPAAQLGKPGTTECDG